jgi:hypothetical protein
VLNSITVLWRTCVKFTELQNLIFCSRFFVSYCYTVVHFLSFLFVIPSSQRRSFHCLSLPILPSCVAQSFVIFTIPFVPPKSRTEQAIRFLVERRVHEDPHSTRTALILGPYVRSSPSGKHCFIFGRSGVQVSDRKCTILTEIFHGIPQLPGKFRDSTDDSRYTRFRISAVLFQCHEKHQYPIRGRILKHVTCVEPSPGLSGNVMQVINLASKNSGASLTMTVLPRSPLYAYNNRKFWKELTCLLSLHYLKMLFALKPAFAPT